MRASPQIPMTNKRCGSREVRTLSMTLSFPRSNCMLAYRFQACNTNASDTAAAQWRLVRPNGSRLGHGEKTSGAYDCSPSRGGASPA
jgi:hypothetical protein